MTFGGGKAGCVRGSTLRCKVWWQCLPVGTEAKGVAMAMMFGRWRVFSDLCDHKACFQLASVLLEVPLDFLSDLRQSPLIGTLAKRPLRSARYQWKDLKLSKFCRLAGTRHKNRVLHYLVQELSSVRAASPSEMVENVLTTSERSRRCSVMHSFRMLHSVCWRCSDWEWLRKKTKEEKERGERRRGKRGKAFRGKHTTYGFNFQPALL